MRVDPVFYDNVITFDLNPRLTEPIFVTQLTSLPPPQIFKMNHRMMLILVLMVSLRVSFINIDTK